MRMKNKNKQDSLSKSSEKKGDLLIQVNELMEKLENDYGPLMLDELKKRLKKTIEELTCIKAKLNIAIKLKP